jgi:AraC-like DNA-binding protein
MDYTLHGGALFSAKNLFFKKLNPCGYVKQELDRSGWVLDFSLDGTMVINGIELPAASWRFENVEMGSRVINSASEEHSFFLSICLHENPYLDIILYRNKKGVFSTAMAYPLLKVISFLEEKQSAFENDISLICYIQLLLIQLNKPDLQKSSYKYEELSEIYKLVSSLEGHIGNFPLPSEVIRKSGIHKSRFQKACHAIYGQSVQKIIHHLKMSHAYSAILKDRNEIVHISTSLGYGHSPNFITAFHNHFGITPKEAIRLQVG